VVVVSIKVALTAVVVQALVVTEDLNINRFPVI
jgi:hypothetical protein